MAVLAVSVEVTVLTVMAGLSKTTVFVDVFVQAWGMVQVGAEVYEFDSILRRLVL